MRKYLDKAYAVQDYLEKLDAMPTVGALASECFCTERTLRRFFLRHFGISPKALLRLQRFRKAADQFDGKKIDKLCEVSDRFGYYDHAHFSNEFRFFMGMTPAEFRVIGPK